ncbi:hypothetical protein GCM10017586_03890 [Microbacterium imperiale]|uniref:Uncharacterized protein n=1 Tax=Microbacterium imperiale TaxID=33884 RepID=A0A9W6M2E1_9MICO|nr:hypothetical protein GCM10017544_12720 [Microbacterium imperiale]GLJ78707.1 hypothetical protein GCM10017586_03890 [Microbacterium imperiale]
MRCCPPHHWSSDAVEALVTLRFADETSVVQTRFALSALTRAAQLRWRLVIALDRTMAERMAEARALARPRP